MARITIEDCMEKVPNRFHLVRMASIRAKQLKKGARPLLTSEDNKDIVMSLREIAAGLVKPGKAEPLPPIRPIAPVPVSCADVLLPGPEAAPRRSAREGEPRASTGMTSSKKRATTEPSARVASHCGLGKPSDDRDRQTELDRACRCRARCVSIESPSSSVQQIVHQREAQARSAIPRTGAVVHLIELVPDAALIVGADADAGVGNPAAQASVRRFARRSGSCRCSVNLTALSSRWNRIWFSLPRSVRIFPIDSGISFWISTGLSQRASWTLKIVSSMTSETESSWISIGELVLLEAPQVEDVLERALEGRALVEGAGARCLT